MRCRMETIPGIGSRMLMMSRNIGLLVVRMAKLPQIGNIPNRPQPALKTIKLPEYA